MAFNFSALQYERTYRAKSNANWEYPRFSPPRPRSLASNCKPITDNQGHLLPKAPREGHFLGHYRGTYHLPLRITRSFANAYDACLSGRYKYRDFPRDLCCCQWERHKQTKCDWRTTLGKKGDPYWERPKCQEKCEGLQQLLKIEHLHKHCKHQKCLPKANEKLIPLVADTSLRNRKRLRKRPVTAFEYNRANRGFGTGTVIKEPQTANSDKDKSDKSDTKSTKESKSTAKSPTKAPSKTKSK